MFALQPWTRRTSMARETPFGWLPEEFGNLFRPFALTLPEFEMPEWPERFAITTEEKEKEFVMRFELPGFAPEEVKVELTGEELTVEAEHKEAAEKGTEKTERVSRAKRVITLPPEVEPEKLEATYRHGVLEVHLPRKAEVEARRIEVKT